MRKWMWIAVAAIIVVGGGVAVQQPRGGPFAGHAGRRRLHLAGPRQGQADRAAGKTKHAIDDLGNKAKQFVDSIRDKVRRSDKT